MPKADVPVSGTELRVLTNFPAVALDGNGSHRYGSVEIVPCLYLPGSYDPVHSSIFWQTRV
jgi:hypothetical protein